MPRFYANTWMTTNEQVAFAWKHRDHFAEVRAHNMAMNIRRIRGDLTGKFRNPWSELANAQDAKPYPDTQEEKAA